MWRRSCNNRNQFAALVGRDHILARASPFNGQFIAVIGGLDEFYLNAAIVQPGRAKVVHQGFDQVTVDGDSRHQRPPKPVAARHLIAVHAIFAMSAEVAGDDVIRSHGVILRLIKGF